MGWAMGDSENQGTYRSDLKPIHYSFIVCWTHLTHTIYCVLIEIQWWLTRKPVTLVSLKIRNCAHSLSPGTEHETIMQQCATLHTRES